METVITSFVCTSAFMFASAAIVCPLVWAYLKVDLPAPAIAAAASLLCLVYGFYLCNALVLLGVAAAMAVMIFVLYQITQFPHSGNPFPPSKPQ
jgi:hypothetical protein